MPRRKTGHKSYTYSLDPLVDEMLTALTKNPAVRKSKSELVGVAVGRLMSDWDGQNDLFRRWSESINGH